MAKTKKGKSAANRKKQSMTLPEAVFLLSPFCLGLFYEPLSALASLLLLGWLGWRLFHKGILCIKNTLSFWGLTGLGATYLLSVFWAADKGMAPIGFVKFLPLPLFLLCCMELDPDQKKRMLQRLPYTAAAMTILSFVLGWADALYDVVYEGRRLAGLFQYANSFALYLLLGVLILFQKEGKWKQKELFCLGVLFLGIAFSGSRTTMLLLALAVLIHTVSNRTCSLNRFLPAGLLVLTLGLGLLGSPESAGRFISSLGDVSSLTNRLLYWQDALPLIGGNPLGLGYLGYYYAQGSFQTGMYNTMFVHNDFLQLLLDAGWIPFALLAGAVMASIRKSGWNKRSLLIFFLLHCLMDFDLQFAALGMVLVLLMDYEGKRSFHLNKRPAAVCGALLFLFCLYFGGASALWRLGSHRAAAVLYPGLTMSQIELLKEMDTAETMEGQAETVLQLNPSVSLAWSAKARVALLELDLERVEKYKKEAIRLSRYSREEYMDYIDLLASAWDSFRERGDAAGEDACLREIKKVPDYMEEAQKSLSPLGRMIPLQPDLTLPPEYAWVEEL